MNNLSIDLNTPKDGLIHVVALSAKITELHKSTDGSLPSLNNQVMVLMPLLPLVNRSSSSRCNTFKITHLSFMYDPAPR